MIKKLLIILSLLVILSLLLAGTVQGKQELTITHFWGGTEKELFDKVLDRFEELYPEVKLVRLAIPSEQYRATIGAQVAAGTPPDVFLSAWPAQLNELAAAEKLLPLDELWEEYDWGKYYTNAWKDLSVYEGHTYAVFFLANQRSIVWYTVSQFSELGLKEPRTWDEFLEICDKFKAAGISPIITGGKDGWPLTDWFENLILRVGGPDIFMKLARHEIPWTHPKVVETLQVWKDLLDKGYFAPNLLGYGWWEAFLKRVKGEAGMQLMGGWVNACTKAEFGWTPGVDFTYFVFPVIDPDIPPNWIEISGNSFSIFKDAKNIEDAKIFLDFIISPEAGKVWAETGRTTPNKLVPFYVYDANAKKEAMELATYNVVFVLDDIIPTELSTEFRVQLQRFIADPTKIQDVLTAIEAKAKELY